MFVFTGDSASLARWIRDEIELDETVSEGRRGKAVKRVQEWLTLHGFGVAIDSDFGPAFDTIEGNTNDDGNREGFEVCARSRGFAKKDVICLS
jgi:hypothetical protein